MKKTTRYGNAVQKLQHEIERLRVQPMDAHRVLKEYAGQPPQSLHKSYRSQDTLRIVNYCDRSYIAPRVFIGKRAIVAWRMLRTIEWSDEGVQTLAADLKLFNDAVDRRLLREVQSDRAGTPLAEMPEGA